MAAHDPFNSNTTYGANSYSAYRINPSYSAGTASYTVTLTGPYKEPAPQIKRIGDLLLFVDTGKLVPLRKIPNKQRKELGL